MKNVDNNFMELKNDSNIKEKDQFIDVQVKSSGIKSLKLPPKSQQK